MQSRALASFAFLCIVALFTPQIRFHFDAGLYIIEFSPPPVGGGEIKGSGDGEENQRGKKEKKRKFGENITFDSTKS